MRKFTLLLVVVAFVLFVATVAGAMEETIDITGSTTVLPITQILAEEFMNRYPDISVTVSGGGSGVGIAAVIDGTVPIAQSSRKMRQEEIDLALERGIEIVEIKIGSDALTCVVHPSNPLEEISIETLNRIYTGELTNWSELNGWDNDIVIVSRDTASGTFEVWNEHIMEDEELTPVALRLGSNAAIQAEVAGNQYAIGYLGLGYVTDAVKTLAIDGVEPTAENALSGEYPIARGLYYYVAGEPEGVVKQFIDFALGPEGQIIVAEEGFIPLQ